MGVILPRKWKHHGRTKSKNRGRESITYCSNCGRAIPKDKAIRVQRAVSLVDPQLEKELVKQGALIVRGRVSKELCVSCAVFYGIVKIGGRAEKAARGLIEE